MPEKVKIREDMQIIQIDSCGHVSADDLNGSLEAVIKISDERGINKVLVDAMRLDTLPSAGFIYQFGESLTKAFVRGVQFAIVIPQNSKADHRFMETIAQNRGGLFMDFHYREDALDWLMREPNFM